MRAVIWSKTIIVDDNLRQFHASVTEAVDALEQAGQQFGWSEAIISNSPDDAVPPTEILASCQMEEYKYGEGEGLAP